jgi:hypothetical protein
LYYGPANSNSNETLFGEFQTSLREHVTYDEAEVSSMEDLGLTDYSDMDDKLLTKKRNEKFIDIDLATEDGSSSDHSYDFLLEDLLKYSTYRFRLLAIDSILAKNLNLSSQEFEESEDYFDLQNAAAELIIETPSDVPDAAPENVQAETLNTSSISLVWNLPPIEKRNGMIIGYKIAIKENDKQVWNSNVDSEPRKKIISGLLPGHKYSFRITARTINGSGPASDWFIAETFTHEMDG